MIRIPLRVGGVDLEDDATLEVLAEHLADLAWSEVDGVVVATLYTSTKNPVATAIEAARRICHVLPGAEVLEVDQELVSTSDIALRLGVSREAVRLWVEGRRGPGGFPRPVGVVGGGRSRVWRWADVHAWTRRNYRLGDDEEHLTTSQVAELNAALLRVRHPIDDEWREISSFGGTARQQRDGNEHVRQLLAQLIENLLTDRVKGHMHLALSSGWSRWAVHRPYGGRIQLTDATPAHVEGPRE
jgi:predicted DNA-binding transcriptional regulator AlpA